MAGNSHHHPRLDPTLRTRLVAEFRERWTRAGRPGQVQHILGNMSQAHGVPLGVLKDIARTVRAEHEQYAMASDHTKLWNGWSGRLNRWPSPRIIWSP